MTSVIILACSVWMVLVAGAATATVAADSILNTPPVVVVVRAGVRVVGR